MKKAQGEIFGVALLFVVIIIGVITFSALSSISPEVGEDSFESRQYSILATDALNAIKKMSTSCEIERDRDSVEDLIRYCFEFSRHSQHDPSVECGGEQKQACKLSLEIINESLQHLFNETDGIVGPIPFSLAIANPDYEHEVWHNVTLTNVGDYGLSLDRQEDDFYLRQNHQRENAGFDIISSGRRNIELTFDVYYR